MKTNLHRLGKRGRAGGPFAKAVLAEWLNR